jgi:hypothetical protein
LNETNQRQVARWFRVLDPEVARIYAPVEEHFRKEPKPALVAVFTTRVQDGKVYFLMRGETERKKDLAVPGFMQVLMSAPEQDRHWTSPRIDQSGQDVDARIALANWITDSHHGAGQLLARVLVNRLWLHHLGQGIVRTPNDFGAQGEPPTHPELLDWLADQLIRGGWRIKPLHRLIMTSSVYMQDGGETSPPMAAGPDNTLCWRRPVTRLEAEAIRDSLLTVGGSLDTAMFGPGTLDESNRRRSIYLTVKRSKPIPLLQLFDAPEAIQSIGQRQVTTAPTQALALMNSAFLRQCAEQFARRIRPEPHGLPAAIENAYRSAFCRRPTEDETTTMLRFIERQADSYGKGDEAAQQALTDFCQILLCSNEFVYVD